MARTKSDPDPVPKKKARTKEGRTKAEKEAADREFEEEENQEAAFEKAWREEAARRLQRIQEASKGGTHPRTEEDDEETDAELCLICRDFDCQCPPVFVEALEAFRSP